MKKRIILLASAPSSRWRRFNTAITLGNEKKLVLSTTAFAGRSARSRPTAILWVVWVPGDSNPKSGGAIWVASYDGTTVSGALQRDRDNEHQGQPPPITTSPKGHVACVLGHRRRQCHLLRVRNPRPRPGGPIETVGVGYGGTSPAAPDGR
jgi:hypothetical protein